MPRDLALHATLVFLLVRSLLNTLEILLSRGDYQTQGIYSWHTRRSRRSWTRHARVARLLEQPFSGNGFFLLTAMQLLLCVALLGGTLHLDRDPSMALLWCWFLLEVLSDIRNSGFGRDGSDRMHLLVLIAVVISFTFSQPMARTIGIVFIALQASLAYVTAGTIKVLSPRWRDGRAMAVVLSSENYGTPTIGAWLSRHRAASWVLGWGVICFELSFTGLLLAPPRVVLPALMVAFLFHLSIAAMMGLNGFLWSFAATYPAVLWVAGTSMPSIHLFPFRG